MKYELTIENLGVVASKIENFLSTGKVKILNDPAHNTTGYLDFPEGHCAARFRRVMDGTIDATLHIGNPFCDAGSFVSLKDEVIMDSETSMSIVSDGGFHRTMFLKEA